MYTERRGVAVAILALIAASSLAAGPVYGGEHKPKGSKSLVAGISSDRAASIARNATGGRVLKVKRKGGVYQVRVLLDGERVRNVSVDAQTGQLRD